MAAKNIRRLKEVSPRKKVLYFCHDWYTRKHIITTIFRKISIPFQISKGIVRLTNLQQTLKLVIGHLRHREYGLKASLEKSR